MEREGVAGRERKNHRGNEYTKFHDDLLSND
jgi:hypothetical protein